MYQDISMYVHELVVSTESVWFKVHFGSLAQIVYNQEENTMKDAREPLCDTGSLDVGWGGHHGDII